MTRPEQPQPVSALLAAARSYADAKLALEDHQGEHAGRDYANMLGRWHNATAELARAARSFASWQRAQEKAATMRAAAEAMIANPITEPLTEVA